jgi:hypothetical protein
VDNNLPLRARDLVKVGGISIRHFLRHSHRFLGAVWHDYQRVNALRSLGALLIVGSGVVKGNEAERTGWNSANCMV